MSKGKGKTKRGMVEPAEALRPEGAQSQAGLEGSHPGIRLWSESNGYSVGDKQPLLATLQIELDPFVVHGIQCILDARSSGRDILILEDPDLIAAVENLVRHKTSPSVGAPDGAGVGTSEHTGGDDVGVPGAKPGTPIVNIDINALLQPYEPSIDALLRRLLPSTLQKPKRDLQ